jgi:hypothetical protein
MATSSPKSSRELLVSVLVAIIGLIGSIAAALITANKAAGPAAQRELDERSASVEELKKGVSSLGIQIQALEQEMKNIRLLGKPDSSKELNREYVADSDGLVSAWVVVHDKSQVVVLYGDVAASGESEPAQRGISHIYTEGKETRSGQLSFPVRKGERWKIRVSAQKDEIDIKGSQVLWIPWT